MKIDLHAHTIASDGSLTPTQLVEHAVHCGVKILAVTDHDTVAGVQEAQAAGARLGVEVVPGIEFSAEYPTGTMHLLGYFIDVDSPAILKLTNWTVEQRNTRFPRMVEKLASFDIDISVNEVVLAARGGVIGRPHIAKVLCAKGIATSIDDAFARFLNRGCPAYVSSLKVSPADAIAAIHAAGGVAILAHPYQLRCPNDAALEEVVVSLIGLGLDGIEVYYSRHDQTRREAYLALAQKHHLLISGGSDFHGDPKPDIELGTGCGDLHVPPEILEALCARATSIST